LTRWYIRRDEITDACRALLVRAVVGDRRRDAKVAIGLAEELAERLRWWPVRDECGHVLDPGKLAGCDLLELGVIGQEDSTARIREHDLRNCDLLIAELEKPSVVGDRADARQQVMLSAGAGPADFERSLHYAYRAGASGYLAGRAIWWEPFTHFPDLRRMDSALASESVGVLERLHALTAARAVPWHANGPAAPSAAAPSAVHDEPSFPAAYGTV
jgi:hypothetical protein